MRRITHLVLTCHAVHNSKSCATQHAKGPKLSQCADQSCLTATVLQHQCIQTNIGNKEHFYNLQNRKNCLSSLSMYTTTAILEFKYTPTFQITLSHYVTLPVSIKKYYQSRKEMRQMQQWQAVQQMATNFLIICICLFALILLFELVRQLFKTKKIVC